MNRTHISIVVAALALTLSSSARAVTADFGTALSPSGSGYDTGTSPFDPSRTSFTVEAWIKPISTTAYSAIFGQLAGTGTAGVWLAVKSNKLYTSFSAGKVVLLGATTVTSGTWHHVALVHDRPRHVLYQYLDGVVVGTIYGFVISGNGHLYVGGDGAGSAFNGSVDEARVWSRARGKYEIQKDMNLVLKGDETNLTADYNFEDGAKSDRVTDDKTGFSTICWSGSVSGVLPGANAGVGTLTYALVSQGTLGTTTVTSATGKFTYTSNGTSGYDTVKYSVSDGTTTATQSLTVGVGTLSHHLSLLTGSANPLYGLGFWTGDNHVRFVDIDGDGDLDFYDFDNVGYAGYGQNTGTAYSPSLSNATNPIPTEQWCHSGSTTYYETATMCSEGACNTWSGTTDYTCTNGAPACLANGTLLCEDNYMIYPYLTMAWVDQGNNATWDFYSILGPADNELRFYKNTGTSTSPSLAQFVTSNGFVTTPNTALYTDVVFADIYGNGSGDAVFLKPGATNPLVTYQSAADLLWNKANTDPLSTFNASGSNLTMSSLAIGDLDGDGAYDIALGGYSTQGWDKDLVLYYNAGTSASPSFSSPTTSPFSTLSAPLVGSVTFADFDGDGDLEVVEGGDSCADGISYYRNDTNFYVKLTAPVASSVAVTISGNKATGSYTYSSTGDGLSDFGSSYALQRADDAGGTNSSTLNTGSSYTLTTSDNMKYLRYCVTPANANGAGTQTCSSWTAVGPLLEMYSDTSYGGTSVNIAWERSSYGNCFNLSDNSFASMMSSFKFIGYESGPATLWTFMGTGCTGTSGTFTNSVRGGNFDLSNIGNTWNDKTVSIKVTTASDTSTYFKVINKHSSMCIDVRLNSTSPGAIVQQYGCSGSTAQAFKLTADGSGYYYLVGENSGNCIDILNASTANGATIQTWGCNGSGAQKYYFLTDGTGYYQIVNSNSGKCLDVTNFSTSAETALQLYSCSTGDNQKWTITGL